MALLTLAVMLATLALGATSAAAASGRGGGALYSLTNAVGGNAVVRFDRGADGSLTSGGTFATGGLGSGDGLGSQGSVTLSDDGRWLLAVNPGSDDLSLFAVRGNRGGGGSSLALLDVVASGGDRPISVTVARNVVYVLNGGGAGNISGFTINRGQLVPLPGSTRPLSGAGVAPAQVQFSPDSRMLVVTEKGTNRIDTYIVDRRGMANGPSVNASSGMTPFGFDIARNGTLIVSEAFGGAPDASALSSYRLGDGALDLVSGSVATTETAACWVTITDNGKYVYTTNTGSASVTGYAVGQDGSLTLLDADGKTGATGAMPIDIALSANSEFLYTLNNGSYSLSMFRVNADGSLTNLGELTGLAVGMVGLAAR